LQKATPFASVETLAFEVLLGTDGMALLKVPLKVGLVGKPQSKRHLGQTQTLLQ
jgi:hypothetical protein